MVQKLESIDFREPRIWLARGTFGDVFQSSWEGKEIVQKVFSKEKNRDIFYNEIFILRQIHHASIPKLFGYLKDPMILIMEKKPGINFADFLCCSCPFPEGIETIRRISIDIAEIMDFLHKKKILYRDLKPDNLLFEPCRQKIYLVDFGLSVFLGQNEDSPFTKGIVGTKGYIAPEILQRKMYSYPIDIYAFGKTIYCMFVFPYYERTKKFPPEKKIDPFFMSLVNQCCKRNPKTRPTFPEILQYLRQFKEFGVSSSIKPWWKKIFCCFCRIF